MASLVIDINKIGKTYKIGEVVVNALETIDLKIEKGEYVA